MSTDCWTNTQRDSYIAPNILCIWGYNEVSLFKIFTTVLKLLDSVLYHIQLIYSFLICNYNLQFSTYKNRIQFCSFFSPLLFFPQNPLITYQYPDSLVPLSHTVLSQSSSDTYTQRPLVQTYSLSSCDMLSSHSTASL